MFQTSPTELAAADVARATQAVHESLLREANAMQVPAGRAGSQRSGIGEAAARYWTERARESERSKA